MIDYENKHTRPKYIAKKIHKTGVYTKMVITHSSQVLYEPRICIITLNQKKQKKIVTELTRYGGEIHE